MTRRAAAAPPAGPQADLHLASALSGLLEALTPYLVEAMVAALATAGFAAGRPSPLAARQPVGGPVAFTVEEAAKRARLSRSWLYQQIAVGNLVTHKAGSRSLVLAADLDAFLAALPTLRLGSTDGATGATTATARASRPVGQPRAADGDGPNGAAAGDRRAAKRDEPRHVDRDADRGGADEGRRRPVPPRRGQRAPTPRRAAKSRGPL